MQFEIVGEIREAETIAIGRGIRELRPVVRDYGPGRWRKRKGIATVELPTGVLREAELHWYEAHGIGKREIKFKRYVDR